jgi:hypothetical protein
MQRRRDYLIYFNECTVDLCNFEIKGFNVILQKKKSYCCETSTVYVYMMSRILNSFCLM